MTLIVADIFDADRVALVADTLVTWDPGYRPPMPGTEELAKIVILRDDLAVGIAGKDPHGRIRDVVAMREADVSDLLSMLEEDPVAGFVVATIGPARIWNVADGIAIERTSLGRAWEGDQTAYEDEYLPHFANDFVSDPIPFRQMTSMQWVTSFRRSSVVGGRAMRVVGASDGFRFVADQQFILGEEESIFFAGESPTPGALGIYYPSRKIGGLFRQEAPDSPVEVIASSAAEFRTKAHDEHRQVIRHARPA
jgi:hypothetical protein